MHYIWTRTMCLTKTIRSTRAFHRSSFNNQIQVPLVKETKGSWKHTCSFCHNPDHNHSQPAVLLEQHEAASAHHANSEISASVIEVHHKNSTTASVCIKSKIPPVRALETTWSLYLKEEGIIFPSRITAFHRTEALCKLEAHPKALQFISHYLNKYPKRTEIHLQLLEFTTNNKITDAGALPLTLTASG